MSLSIWLLPAVSAVQLAPVLALPQLPALAASCTVPTLLGYVKSEWGVSYAYGGATALVGALTLPHATTAVGRAHALTILLYGARLNVFLLWRELSFERFRKLRERIEDRAVSRGSRLARTPFIASCSFLYFCMTAPLHVTASAPPTAALRACVAASAIGFFVAAAGDIGKSIVKARRGEDALVAFPLLRHPNYTGEMLGWLANAGAATAAAASSGGGAAWVGASWVGFAGIAFVLKQATAGLEKKQAERYGDTTEYKEWVRTTWGGVGSVRKIKQD